MTPDQISKLPPELQIWAKMLNRLRDEGSLNVDQERLYAALTWGLQVVEERDAAKGMFAEQMRLKDEYIALFRTAEATIATLRREREKLKLMATGK